MERMVLPKKLNDQYKFIEALRDFAYDTPTIITWENLLEVKQIPQRKLSLLAKNNSYVADTIEDIKYMLSSRIQRLWMRQDSGYREDACKRMFRAHNREYHEWLREIEVAKTTATIERNAQRQVINVISDPVKSTEAVKLWEENEARSRITSVPER